MGKPIQRLERHTKINNIWMYILSLLNKKKLHAYTLNQEIKNTFKFKPSRIMIYLVLYKLENEKLISSYLKDRRKYYKITPKGKNELKEAKKYLLKLSKTI
ncbi:PadR family transcriptional regulator [Candidatus Micrarchaeota archaeon]|jgi:DNA-binding PadR family transcriptional regulator|nr:PadR family transcriptional regulator [Candidatus Micrarchaeota archaeon]